MFDIGFWELSLIAIVALLVVGPERLPKLARTAGLWVGKARGFVSSVKADIDRELKAEELKQIMEKQARSNPLEEIIEETIDPKPAPASKPREDSHDSGDDSGSRPSS